MNIKYLSAIGAILLGACAMTSCSDDTYDVYGNPDNLVYVNIAHDYPSNMPKNTFAYTVFRTPVGPLVVEEPGEINLNVMCTKNAPSDIKVKLSIDPNKTVAGFASLPTNSGLQISLDNSYVTIPKGQTHSSDAHVTVNVDNVDWSLFTEDAYLLPIKVEAVEGATPSTELCAAYIGFNLDTKEGMINTAATYVDGEKISTAGFSGTWEAPDAGRSGNLGGRAFDDNQWTNAFYVSNHADKCNEKLILNIDMGAPYAVKGFKLLYYSYWYTVKDAKVETSLDGENYTDQGTITFPDNNNFARYVAFWAPLTYQYVRITTHSYYGGTGEGTAFSSYIPYM